jgi:hypothetical protein
VMLIDKYPEIGAVFSSQAAAENEVRVLAEESPGTLTWIAEHRVHD